MGEHDDHHEAAARAAWRQDGTGRDGAGLGGIEHHGIGHRGIGHGAIVAASGGHAGQGPPGAADNAARTGEVAPAGYRAGEGGAR